MAKFLNSSGISHYLENLIKNANISLFLISPYLKFNSRIKQLLDDRNRRRKDIRIIYGKVDLQTEESDWLKSMDSIKVLFCKNLHAKCYMNEEEAIITSMNLYEFSQQNNNEMGIYVTKKDDPELYQGISEEVDSLLQTSEYMSISIEKIPKETAKPYKKKFSKGQKGFCIKCKKEIKLNPEVPYCKDCYNEWKKHKDKKYQEKYCHICGESNKSSFLKPTCYPCYKKYKNTLTFPLEV